MSGTAWLRVGAISGALAVGFGAFGAHGLRGRFDAAVERGAMAAADAARGLEVFDTASRYQMYHALALLVVGLLAARARPSAALATAGWAFAIGTILFSGSLYALTFSGRRWLGMVTPLGGLGFLVGWIALAMAALPASKWDVP